MALLGHLLLVAAQEAEFRDCGCKVGFFDIDIGTYKGKPGSEDLLKHMKMMHIKEGEVDE